MKKIIKSVSAFMLIMVMLFASSVICVSAAEDELEVDGRVSYKVGDTLTYNILLEGVKEPIVGIQMYINYESEYLKINPDSLKFEKFSNPVYNADLTDRFTFNWTNVTKGVEFSEKASLVSVDFEILKAGKTNIKEFIEEMYPKDLTKITDYTMTVQYSENGTVVKEDVPPIVEDDPEFVAEHQGQFVNYNDGKGEDSTDVSEGRQAITAANNGNNANNNADNNNQAANAAPVTDANGNVVATNAQGVPLATDASGNYLDDSGNALSTDASGNYLDKDGNIYQPAATTTTANPTNIGPIIIIIAIVLIVLAIIVIIFLKARSNKSKAADDEEKMGTKQFDSDDNPEETDDLDELEAPDDDGNE